MANPQKNVELPQMNHLGNVFCTKSDNYAVYIENKSSGRLWRPELVVCVGFWRLEVEVHRFGVEEHG